ncbi:hypothetical protein ACSBR2_039191 [Camellia fascicularis]
MAGSQQQEHIVMLPFMAHGHLVPFLALATQIHQTTGSTITIATTPLNIHYLRHSITTANHRQIHLVALPLNSSHHGLPPNTEQRGRAFEPTHNSILCFGVPRSTVLLSTIPLPKMQYRPWA